MEEVWLQNLPVWIRGAQYLYPARKYAVRQNKKILERKHKVVFSFWFELR
jgi:hypothetical protein